MALITTLCATLIWLALCKLKLVRLSLLSGMIAAATGLIMLAMGTALCNYLTPAGRFVIVSTVTQIIPNVSGQVVAISVKPNQPVKRGDVLFQIDPAPFQYKVSQLEAALAQAKQQTDQLKVSYQEAKANAEGLAAQYAHYRLRLATIEQETREGVLSQFRAQDTRNQYEVINFQLQAAEAAQQKARLAMDSQIGGVNTTVAQIEAQLADAKWQLAQATVRAPADGTVSIMSLSVGDRVIDSKGVMSIIENDIVVIGMFPPNGFQTIRPGARVKLVFDNAPGRVYDAKITDIPRGIGQGEIAPSGTLAQISTSGTAATYPAVISVPSELDRDQLRLGMPGRAMVFAERAGVIGLVSLAMIWANACLAYF
jgi:multidrug resistance efflux pump